VLSGQFPFQSRSCQIRTNSLTPAAGYEFAKSEPHVPELWNLVRANFESRITQSKAAATWAKSKAALSALAAYALETGDGVSWPLSEAGFSSWADLTCQLSAATFRSYISSFSQAQVLTGMSLIHLKDLPRVKAFQVGLERCPREGGRTRPARRAVSFPLLRLMGHFLGESGSSRDNLVLWAAMLAAFFGSMRIGELFPPGKPLVWDDVTIGAHYVLFRLRTP